MKQTAMLRFMTIVKSLALAGLVFLAGCSDIIAPQVKGQGAAAGPGTGTVRIGIAGSGAQAYQSVRTLLPETNGGFTKYVLLFEADGKDNVTVDPYTLNDRVTLAEGTWTVTVSAYLPNGGGTRLAAKGEHEVHVVYAAAGETVTVDLLPVDTDAVSLTGTGTFSWDISFPADTDTVDMVITNLGGSVVQSLNLKGGTVIGTLAGGGDGNTGSVTLDAGSHYVTTTLTKAGTPAPTALRRDALYILKDLTTKTEGYAFINSDFSVPTIRYVTSVDDSAAAAATPGTFRWAITTANNGSGGDTIQVALPKGSVIGLADPLPQIMKNVTIEGNGVTLSPIAGYSTGADSQFLTINLLSTITIRRVHFKDGWATQRGAAIYNSGILTLESCIFSGNQITASDAANGGGAIYNTYSGSVLTVLGCTFYQNIAAVGPVICVNQGTTKMAGNLFYGNTGTVGGDKRVAYDATSLGYNVSDMVTGTNPASESGFDFVTGDTTITTGSVSRVTFKPGAGSGVLGKVDTAAFNTDNSPLVYPTMDFYGDPISPVTAAAGAVQTPGVGYIFELTWGGPGSASGGPAFNADGFVDPGAAFTLTATPTSSTNNYLVFWTVNGVKQTENPLPVTMNENTEVKAVFGRNVSVTSNVGGGINDVNSLNWALSNAQDYDRIFLDASAIAGKTITVTNTWALTSTGKNLVIEGNGVTLTQSGFTGSDNTALLRFAATADVTIRRLHFKNGKAGNLGAAISNSGTLTLESCIFSGNQTVGIGRGGAIYTDNASESPTAKLTVLGCTFHTNSSFAGGGAIWAQQNARVTLAGNLFYGNTATSGGHVVHRYSGTITSLGYNVSNYATGTATPADASGFVFVTEDKQLSVPTTDPVDPADPTHPYKPTAAVLSDITIVPFNLAVYPETDFYGTPRPANGTIPAGAVWQ
jgi:hypothetical protein